MYNVLLVDDEALELEGLLKLVPWEELGFQVVGAVHSGFDALKLIENQHIHLLVSDIKMPIMSGITLLEEAKKKIPCLKSVFISGYQDFQYAQNAIRMKASGYVLKPVDDDELIEVIENVRRQLEEENASKQIKKMYTQSTPYLKNQIICELLEGSFNENTIIQLLEQCNINMFKKTSVAVIEIDNLQLRLNQYLQKDKKTFLSNILEKIIIEISKQNLEYYYKTIHHKVAIIFGGTQEEIDLQLRSLINQIERHSECTITIGVGQEAQNIHTIAKSYKQAEKALQHKMFFHKQKIIKFEEITEKTSREFGSFNNLIDSLFNAITSYDLLQIDASLIQLFNYICNLKDKMVVYNFLLNTLFELEIKLNHMNESLYPVIGDKLQYLNELFQYETMDELRIWLSDKIYLIAEKLYIKKQRPNYKLIMEVIDYLEENISERLTLQEVSDHFSFSPNYLGFIFKEEMGENFSSFLINKRIDKACELLRNTRMKVYEVANAVGYNNLSHFSRQFKENVGISSKDYRNECGVKEE